MRACVQISQGGEFSRSLIPGFLVGGGSSNTFLYADCFHSDLLNLKWLYLNRNNITAIPKNTFSGLSALESIDLSHNAITTITNGTFSGLTKLGTLRVHDNSIRTVSRGAFADLKALKVLELHRNSISVIPNGTFLGLDELARLDLSSNHLATISSGNFFGLKPLTWLNLRRNSITTISSGAFVGLKLRWLALNFNNIAVIASDSFAGLTALTDLLLSNSGITTVAAGAFSDLKELIRLYLSWNNVASISRGTFSGLAALKELHLSNSGIATLANGAFTGLTALTQLSLVDNDITSIASGAFAGLTTLTHLDLSDNALTSIPPGAFAGLAVLERLRMEGSNIKHVASGTFSGLAALEELHLSNSGIATLANGAFIGLAGIKWLNLGSNNLTTINSGIFIGVATISKLELDSNNIVVVSSGAFAGLVELRFLNLESNPGLPCFPLDALRPTQNSISAPLIIGMASTAAASRSAATWMLDTACPSSATYCTPTPLPGPEEDTRQVTFSPSSSQICAPNTTVHCCIMLRNRTVTDCSQCATGSVTHVDLSHSGLTSITPHAVESMGTQVTALDVSGNALLARQLPPAVVAAMGVGGVLGSLSELNVSGCGLALLPAVWPSASLRALDASLNAIDAVQQSLYAQWWCAGQGQPPPCVRLEGNPCTTKRYCGAKQRAAVLPEYAWSGGDHGSTCTAVPQRACGAAMPRVCLHSGDATNRRRSLQSAPHSEEGRREQQCIWRAMQAPITQCVCA